MKQGGVLLEGFEGAFRHVVGAFQRDHEDGEEAEVLIHSGWVQEVVVQGLAQGFHESSDGGQVLIGLD